MLHLLYMPAPTATDEAEEEEEDFIEEILGEARLIRRGLISAAATL